MEFHISRAIREKLAVDGLLFSYAGNVVFANVAASRKLANQLNELHASQSGGQADPSKVVNAGALFAMGMIDELKHAFVARYRREIDPAVLSEALKWFAAKIGSEQVDRLLLNFVEQFPGVDVFQGKLTAAQWLAGATEGLSNREAALEELLLLWITNINPAFAPFQELFDDKSLQARTQYKSVTAGLPDYLSTRPPVDSEVGSLFQALQAPMLASPDSRELAEVPGRGSKPGVAGDRCAQRRGCCDLDAVSSAGAGQVWPCRADLGDSGIYRRRVCRLRRPG